MFSPIELTMEINIDSTIEEEKELHLELGSDIINTQYVSLDNISFHVLETGRRAASRNADEDSGNVTLLGIDTSSAQRVVDLDAVRQEVLAEAEVNNKRWEILMNMQEEYDRKLEEARNQFNQALVREEDAKKIQKKLSEELVTLKSEAARLRQAISGLSSKIDYNDSKMSREVSKISDEMALIRQDRWQDRGMLEELNASMQEVRLIAEAARSDTEQPLYTIEPVVNAIQSWVGKFRNKYLSSITRMKVLWNK